MPVIDRPDTGASVREIFAVLRHVASALVALMLMAMAGQALAQQIRFEGVADHGYNWSRSWVDVNNDGRDDYCIIVGGGANLLRCYLSNGSTFGSSPMEVPLSSGATSSGLFWQDVDGDGQVDLCYVVTSGALQCRFGGAFTSLVSLTIPVDNGETAGLVDSRDLFMADVDADGRSDVCYLHGRLNDSTLDLRCFISQGTAGFSSSSTVYSLAAADPGLRDWPRGFHDFDGDGFADFCRVIASAVRCTLGGPSGFRTPDVISASIVVPYKEGAAFVDMNGDGKIDFCRVIGSFGAYTLRCLLSNGVSWQTNGERSSFNIDPGPAPLARWWVDINGDGLPDFCRALAVTGSIGNLSCRLSRGDGDGSLTSAFFFSDVEVATVDFGLADGGRAFCDALGTGIPSYCRATYRAESVGQICYENESGPYCFPGAANVNGIHAGVSDIIQARQPVLSAYTDGLGAETRITYLPMTNPDVYVRSGFGTYPRALISLPRTPVVFESRAWRTGTRLTLTGNARYFYKDLRTDTWTGSRGFRERWMLTEGSNTIDHTVYFQALGPAVDASSLLDHSPEIGLVKFSERYSIARFAIADQAATPTQSARQLMLSTTMARATALPSLAPGGAPDSSRPFMLLQRTSNILGNTIVDNPQYRFVSSSNAESWDWSGAPLAPVVSLPTVNTATTMSRLGNVTDVVQTTTHGGLMWRKTTSNQYGADDESTWLLGRLTRAQVTTEAPSIDAQMALYARSPGSSPNASDTSSPLPPAPQPMSPAVLSAILQLLLDD